MLMVNAQVGFPYTEYLFLRYGLTGTLDLQSVLVRGLPTKEGGKNKNKQMLSICELQVRDELKTFQYHRASIFLSQTITCTKFITAPEMWGIAKTKLHLLSQ